MTPLKKKKYRDDLWKVDIYTLCGGTAQDAAKYAGFAEGIKDVEMEGFVISCGNKYYIWISKPFTHDDFPDIFGHEFTHLVNAIYKEHGASPPLEDDELDARWRGRLARFIWNTCKH